jgi:hypothetical protein
MANAQYLFGSQSFKKCLCKNNRLTNKTRRNILQLKMPSESELIQ